VHSLHPLLLATAIDWLAALPFKRKLMIFGLVLVGVELLFRWLAPKSKAYETWTHTFESVGKVMTVVILSIVYFLSVSFVAVFMRLFAKDPLDRSLEREPSFWRTHEPNPLGPHAAARHQF
jgi:hypothetical protein